MNERMEMQKNKCGVSLSVVYPDYINIMITGHQHNLFKDLAEVLSIDAVQDIAKRAGAKGFCIVGCTCVGQDFQVRKASCGVVSCGQIGDNFTSEAVLMTGCVDLIISEFNCILPGIEEICEKQGIPQIRLDDVTKKANAGYLPYNCENREGILAVIIVEAVTAYTLNREKR